MGCVGVVQGEWAASWELLVVVAVIWVGGLGPRGVVWDAGCVVASSWGWLAAGR